MVFVVFYFGMYGCTLGALFYGIDSNLIPVPTFLDPVTVANKLGSLLDTLRVPENLSKWVKTSPEAGSFAMAWATAKLTEPVRFMVAIYCTPKIAVRLGYAEPLPKSRLASQIKKAASGAAASAASKLKRKRKQEKDDGTSDHFV